MSTFDKYASTWAEAAKDFGRGVGALGAAAVVAATAYSRQVDAQTEAWKADGEWVRKQREAVDEG